MRFRALALRLVVLTTLAVSMAACQKTGDALLVVKLTSPRALPDVRRVVLTVRKASDGGSGQADAPLTYDAPDGGLAVFGEGVTLGVTVRAEIGTVIVRAEVFGVGSKELAWGESTPVTARGGARTDVDVALGELAIGDAGIADGGLDRTGDTRDPGDVSGGGGSGGVGSGGSGGVSGSGGGAGSGGAAGSGGRAGSGGTDAGDVASRLDADADGSAPCSENATRCMENVLQTCGPSGKWDMSTLCGAHQTCTEAAGSAKCTCKADPACSTVGAVCASPSALATCARDGQGCLYQKASSPCTNASCTGAAGAAFCCNACVAATTQCGSATSLETCGPVAGGCTAFSASTCATGLVCERYAPAACVDPNWAEWPMPNSSQDVTSGAPNPQAYQDNMDGTVTDKVTGLIWQQTVDAATTFTFAQALAYCPNLNLGTHTDWRLPSIIELLSIVDETRSDPSIDPAYFPRTSAIAFWSSSRLAGSASDAWYLAFNVGLVGSYDATHAFNVRCVR